jgi:hypothetical protein
MRKGNRAPALLEIARLRIDHRPGTRKGAGGGRRDRNGERERDLVQLALDLEGEGLEVVRRPGPHRPLAAAAGRHPILIWGKGTAGRARLDLLRLWLSLPVFLSAVRTYVLALLRLSGHIWTVHVPSMRGSSSAADVAAVLASWAWTRVKESDTCLGWRLERSMHLR